MSDFYTAKELQNTQVPQLQKILSERQEKLRHLRFQVSSREVKNHRQLRYLKREIARIQTVIGLKVPPVEPGVSN